MKFENTQVWGFEHALRGMRNPKNSHHLSDSAFGLESRHFNSKHNEIARLWAKEEIPHVELESREWYEYYNAKSDYLWKNGILETSDNGDLIKYAYIGPKDMDLAKKLIKGGSEHRKFLRQIFVSVDITAPLFYYKEFDTYKIGTTANSTSTMHKIASKPITLDCFEIDDFNNIEFPPEYQRPEAKTTDDSDVVKMIIIPYLEYLRKQFVETKDKKYWKELIRWLPESWLQTRTVTLTYENIYNMRHQRKFHKLNEWSGQDDPALVNFIAWTDTLPYAADFF